MKVYYITALVVSEMTWNSNTQLIEQEILGLYRDSDRAFKKCEQFKKEGVGIYSDIKVVEGKVE